MTADIEAKVEVKKLLKDERSHKIAGTILILISILLFLSFTSYLFTWQEDQSKVFKGAKILLPSHAESMSNLLGTAGAYFSDLFFRSGFGIASYLFCTFFFIVGVNLFAPKKIFSVSRNIRYVIVGLLVISVTASFLFKGHPFPWGGAVGDMENQWLQQMIGKVGTAALLLVAVMSYTIWRFNPSFDFINKKLIPGRSETDDEILVPVDSLEDASSKSSNDHFVPLMNIPIKNDNGINHDLQIIEKNDEPSIVKEDARKEFFVPEVREEKSKAPTLNSSPESGLQLEVKSFPVESEKEPDIIPKPKIQQQPYDPILDLRNYKFPTVDLLETHGSEKIIQDVTELETNKNQIINTLKNYDIEIQKIYATVGPTVTLYEIVPAPGVRISRIKNLEDDIALSLAALGIRIIAPIPGKGTIGIEVPNVKKTVVSMRTLLNSEKFQNNNFSLPIAIGKKIDNENFIVDLTTMPHLLMAGATGQGKSVGLNAILVSLLYKKHPSQLKLVLIDPKKVELSIYKSIEKHFLAKLPGEEDAIITDTKKVIHTLNALCIEMDNRYDLLKEAGTRNIREYNEKFVARKLNPEKGHQYLPFIVLVIDEFADLIMTAGKEVEMPIARLAQLARAVGIHLIIATQRPSVNIITGTIKANFPVRIAFKVSSKIDSRTILDIGGAEQLIGKGDMLISYNGELTR
ncbi:MAG TPA: DNA translocase FtsK 4TM domain-containing protein, partial [Ginsengibacter sp.]|nr:DNA translocase FtsK 4TM domain-containing protein [Ginsengibacter sp.]